MAPEAWRQKGGRQSDQYGLALCYVELRQDRFPFSSTVLAEVMNDHLHTTPDLADLGDAERQVLLRALAKDPGARFESCQAFVSALRQALVNDSALPTAAF